MFVSLNCRNIKQAACPEQKRSPNDLQLLLTTSVRVEEWEESMMGGGHSFHGQLDWGPDPDRPPARRNVFVRV